MVLDGIRREGTLHLEAVSAKSVLPSEQNRSVLQLPGASGNLQVTFNTTNHIKEAPKHPAADIIDALGKCVISIAMGVATFFLTKRTIDLGASVENIHSALKTIASLGK